MNDIHNKLLYLSISQLMSPVANSRSTSPVPGGAVKGRINAAQQKLLQEQFDQAAHPQFDLESIAGELVNDTICCL